ncbi:WxL domain-containing protein [Levilactobacillus fujinensis]|uniref:WxL domain-containing protein n=1 Tax=Levilactobacillus fujinensis TaxID=2486024 RepID=A0ABW1THD9_9LACO|nr:WxL domain-containing protein [Levilactobacillus fujinensis]
MGFSRWLRVGLSFIAVSFGLGSWCVGHAADDYYDALASAPQGIILDKTNPFVTVETTNKSSANIVDADNPETPGTQVAMLTNGSNQFGSIWSTDTGYLRLDQDQTFSMWLYLGDRDTDSGDGMAFVLQNDGHGVGAMPSSRRNPIPGETLGVWGVDDDPKQETSQGIAATAIQRSWALEFDTNYNGVSGDDAPGKSLAFDSGYPVVHVASNYPGEARTYPQNVIDNGFWHGLLGGQRRAYFYNMVHRGVIHNVNKPNFLANGQWHHVTINYEKNGTLIYTIDDRDPQTNTRRTGMSQTIALDHKIVDPDGTKKIRWGLTAATGSLYEKHMVIFENIPGMIDADIQTSLTDLNRQRPVNPGGQVLSGSRLRLDYDLTYRSGRQPWSDIVANLKIPTDINVEEVSITTSNGHKEQVSLDKFTDGQLSLPLKSELSQEKSKATISILGQAATVAATRTVDPATSMFTSSGLVNSADTPKFIINPNVGLRLKVTSDNPLKLNSKENTTIEGEVRTTGDATILAGKRVEPRLNNQVLRSIAVNPQGKFALPIMANQLEPGTNRLLLKAITNMGDASEPVEVLITVVGELKFVEVSQQEKFQSTTLTGQPQDVRRAGNWQLRIQDTRGTNEHWTLTAQSGPFKTATGQVLAGQLVYADRYQRIPIGQEATPVLTRKTADNQPFDVANSWDADKGLLLALGGGATVGEYQGTITWGLMDAPGYVGK